MVNTGLSVTMPQTLLKAPSKPLTQKTPMLPVFAGKDPGKKKSSLAWRLSLGSIALALLTLPFLKDRYQETPPSTVEEELAARYAPYLDKNINDIW